MEGSTQPQKGNSMMMIIGAIVVIAVVAVGIMMTRSGNNTEAENTPDNTATIDESVNQDMTVSAEGEQAGDEMEAVQIIEVEAGAFYYKPNEIRVKQGEKVRIVMTSVDMMHDFNIDELGVSIPVTESGNTATVEFVADQKGSFEYYCSVGQHRAQGQVGTLIVE